MAHLNADPAVCRHLPGPLCREDSDALVARLRGHRDRHGFGPWAVELRETGETIGFVGMLVPSFHTHFTPCVEMGWRLSSAHWGKGLATEAARAVVDEAFDHHDFLELVAFTVPENLASRRVMEKLGMVRNPEDDFFHPALPRTHPLARHVLYRIRRPQK
jgi:RimJ/RimL family protein N-acetyltransferase